MVKMKELMPKFLTREIAEVAVATVLATVMNKYTPKCMRPKRRACHITVLVPAMLVPVDSHDSDAAFPNYGIHTRVLYEYSQGRKKDWSADYKNIGHCKSVQLWQGRNVGGTDSVAHLLFPGDTPFWGGVRREGIVVSCSGVEPHFDRMISGMIADICIAAARHAYLNSDDKKEDRDFLAD